MKAKIALVGHLTQATKPFMLKTLIGTLTVAAVTCLAVPIAQASSFLYVTSDRTDSVLQYDEEGNFIGVLDDGLHSGFNGAIGLAFGPDGNLYLSRGYTNTIQRYNQATQNFEVFTSGGSLFGPHQFAFGGPDNDLYVANHDNGTVQRFDGKTGVFKNIIASGLSHAVGLTIDTAGNVYMTSRDQGNVYKYDGQTLSVFASGISPETLLFGPDGYLYVGQFHYFSSPYGGNGNVLRYKTDGTPFGAGGNSSDPTFISSNELNSVGYMAFGSDGKFYVADYSTNNVLRFDGSTGEFIDTFTKPGYPIEGAYGIVLSPKTVPEPSTNLSLLAFGAFSGLVLKRKHQQKVLNFNCK